MIIRVSKAKGKSKKSTFIFAFCLLPFAFCLFSGPLCATTPVATTRVDADLDGDLKPDIVRVASGGRDPLGYLYTIHLQLSSGVNRSPLEVHSAAPNGVRIVARDVNGDHDVDLVVTSTLDLRTIGVWINDGHGGFTWSASEPLNCSVPRHSDLDSTPPGGHAAMSALDSAPAFAISEPAKGARRPPTLTNAPAIDRVAHDSLG